MVKRPERLVRYLKEQYERMETLAQAHARMTEDLEEGRRVSEGETHDQARRENNG